MTFEWLNKQGVQSDKGFVVQFTGRFTAEYREDKKIIKLDIDSGLIGSRPCISVRKNAFMNWSNDSQPISIDEQLRILKNFREALEFQGLALIVD